MGYVDSLSIMVSYPSIPLRVYSIQLVLTLRYISKVLYSIICLIIIDMIYLVNYVTMVPDINEAMSEILFTFYFGIDVSSLIINRTHSISSITSR